MKPVNKFYQVFLKISKKLLILLIFVSLIYISYIFLYFDDSLWSGYWSADVNEADGFAQTTKDYWHLSNSNDELLIKLDVNNGVINGKIISNKICNSQPRLQFVLLKGHVSLVNKSDATVIVYSNIQGRQHDFAKLNLTLSGGVPKEFAGKMLPEILTIQGINENISTYPNNNVRITKIYSTIEDMQSRGIMTACDAKTKSAH